MSKINWKHEEVNLMASMGHTELSFDKVSKAFSIQTRPFLSGEDVDASLSTITEKTIQHLEIELERDLTEEELLSLGIILGQLIAKMKIEQFTQDNL